MTEEKFIKMTLEFEAANADFFEAHSIAITELIAKAEDAKKSPLP